MKVIHMDDKKKKNCALNIMRKFPEYTDAYYAMLDKGFSEIEAGYFWDRLVNFI